MKNSKVKPILRTIAVLSVAASLLLCLSGCKKEKPKPSETDPSTQAPTTTAPAETVKPTTPKPTTPPPTTTPSKPSTPTIPEDTTAPNCVHVLGNWIVDKVSNCTAEGSRYKECTLCKTKVETESIPKTAHSAGNWIIDKKATCEAQGTQYLECTQCTEKLLFITVDKADHKVTTITGYDATATTPGRTDKLVCKTCDAVVQESLPIPLLDSVAYTYDVNSDGTSCTVTGVINYSGREIILPSVISGYTVTAIGEKAFANRTGVSTVYIPKTVTKIGAKAFSDNSALINITYQGTTTQWNTLTKGADWNAATGNYTIYCTNTSIPK